MTEALRHVHSLLLLLEVLNNSISSIPIGATWWSKLPCFGDLFFSLSYRSPLLAGQAKDNPPIQAARQNSYSYEYYIVLSLDLFSALPKLSFTKLLASSHRSRASRNNHYSSFLPVCTGCPFFVTQRVSSSAALTTKT